MPKLAIIGDVHASWPLLERVLARIREEQVHGVLLVGDLGDHNLTLQRNRTPMRDELYLRSVRDVLAKVGDLGLPMAWVPGNHDLPEVPGQGNLDHTVGEVAGLRVAGIGGAGPNRFGFCYEWDEDQIRARTVPECDVLLCHCPPLDTRLDLTKGGHHAGSAAILERARAHTGFLVCGHIHEAAGAQQIDDCLCLNAGALGHPFGHAQVGWLVRDDQGDRVGHEDLDTGELRWWQRG